MSSWQESFAFASIDSAVAREDFPFATRSLTLTRCAKVKTFLFLAFELVAIFRTVAMHLQLYALTSYIVVVQRLHKRWFKFTQNLVQVYTSLQQATCVLHCGPRLQANGSLRAKSGGRWSRSAGSCSPQRLFCTESSVHGILVIKSRQSPTTEIIKRSF